MIVTPEHVLMQLENMLRSMYGADDSVVQRVPEGVLILVRGGPHVLVRVNIASLVVT